MIPPKPVDESASRRIGGVALSKPFSAESKSRRMMTMVVPAAVHAPFCTSISVT